jgi:PAS domain S-box-containing protein
MNKNHSHKTDKEILEEVSELQKQLAEAEGQLDAIRRGDIDALIISDTENQKLLSLNGVIIEEISEGAATVSKDGTILYCNKQFSSFAQIPISKLIGTNINLLVNEKDKPKFLGLINQGINGRYKSEIQFAVDQKDDEQYYFSFSPLPPNSLGEICIMVANITELKKTEEELRTSHTLLEKTVNKRTKELTTTVEELSESRLAALNLMEDTLEAKNDLEKANLELQEHITKLKKADEELRFDSMILTAVGQAVIATDINGLITYWNNAAEIIYGWKYDEIIGKNIIEVTPSEHTKEQADQIMDTLKNGETWSGEFYVKGKNKTSFPVYLTDSPVLDKDGKFIGIIGVSTDISDRKLAEKELIKAKEKAEEANRLKTNFLANMSHELRTPLIGILGYAQFLETELKDKEYIEMAQTIATSGQRLNNTLNNLLDISKIESEIKSVDLKRQDILEYLNEQVTLFKLAAERKGLFIFYKPCCEKLEAYINEEMFVSIISNLLNNAIKFTEKGSITLTVKLAEDKAMIAIMDTGIGVPANRQEIIFEPFRQASEGLNRNFEGTGLGLTLAKKFAALMGGIISVESKPGEGSTFTLELPVNINIEENVITTKW